MKHSRRRWRHRSVTTMATEAAVWSAWFLIVAAVLLGLCVVLTLAAPS